MALMLNSSWIELNDVWANELKGSEGKEHKDSENDSIERIQIFLQEEDFFTEKQHKMI